MLHCPHTWSLVPIMALAPPLPSLFTQPSPETGDLQPRDSGLIAAISPSQPMAEALPTLYPLAADNKLRAWAWTGWLSVCRARVDANT